MDAVTAERRAFSRGGMLLLILTAILGLGWVVGHAWVAEDAFITFRVVDNAANGFGLRWNPDERVQAYSNPLWMFLHIPLRLIHENLFLGTILLSLVLTVAAVVIAARAVRRPPATLAILLLLPLTFSKTMVEFSTSGMENPLSHLLVAAFSWLLFRRFRVPDSRAWFWLAFVASLAAVNRLDTLLIYLPALGYLVVSRRRWFCLKPFAAGFLPLLVWEAFSVFYYGFALPNTAYAKLGGGVPRSDYLEQGIYYLLDWARRDTTAFLIWSVTVVAGILIGVSRGRGRPAGARTEAAAMLTWGALLYGLYIINIGGDFMACRMWSPAAFVAVIALVGGAPRGLDTRRSLVIAFVALVVARGVTVWVQPAERIENERFSSEWRTINDERLWYAEGHSVFSLRRPERFRFSLPAIPEQIPSVVLRYAVGVKAYSCGPQVLTIDGLGLADPLLARLPALPRERFYVGHLRRGVPFGYPEARAYGMPEGMHPELRKYYAPLREIVSGPLLSGDRLMTILKFNLGRYNRHRDAYLRGEQAFSDLEPGVGLQRMTREEVGALLREHREQRGAPDSTSN